MNQHELEREVARLTGESVEAIAAMGFSLVDMSSVVADRRRRLRQDTVRRSFKTVVNKTIKQARKKSAARKASPKNAKVLRPKFRVMEPTPVPSDKVLSLSLMLDFDHPRGA